jgi:branched-chain amino acid transport system permease protein
VLLINEAGFDFYVALVAGVGAATLLASVGGAALVRFEPIAFIMLTFALANLLEFGAAHARGLTGGDSGTIAELPSSLNVTVSANHVYYVVLVVTAVVLVAAFAFVRSRAGLILRAIREDPLRAATLGIAVERRRLGVFALAAAVAAAGGGLSVLSAQIVYPSVFAWQVSASALIVTLLGGVGLFSGPMIGAVLLELIDFYVGRSSTNTVLIDGAVLLAIVLIAPRGVVASGSGSLPGAVSSLARRMRTAARGARAGAAG